MASSSRLNNAQPDSSSHTSSSSEELEVSPLGYHVDSKNTNPSEVIIHRDVPEFNHTSATFINSPHAKLGSELHITVGGNANANVYLGEGRQFLPNQDKPLDSADDSPRTDIDMTPIVHHGEPRTAKQNPSAKMVLMCFFFVVLGLVVAVTIIWYVLQRNTIEPTDWFVTREEWNAVNPKSTPVEIGAAVLFVGKHTGGSSCSAANECVLRVQEIQREHMEEQGFPDISYNFLIGGDGRIYVGRGWGVQNEGRNDSVDVAFIGNFNIETPTDHQISLVRYLEHQGPQEKGLNYNSYCSVNHNQTEPVDSPGTHLYSPLANGYLHYSSAICYSNSSSANPRCPVISRPSYSGRSSKNVTINRRAPIRSKSVYMSLIFLGSIFMIIIGVVVWTESGASEENPSTSTKPDYQITYIPREVWGAMDPKTPHIEAKPAVLFIIKHTGGRACLNHAECSKRVREIQNKHVLDEKFPDISYNFLIGGDGNIYCGRGWRVQNEGIDESLDVAFIGNFNDIEPTKIMMDAVSRIEIDGQRTQQLDGHYCVLSHNQTEPTHSPGSRLFSKVVGFTHYDSLLCYRNNSEQVIIDHDCYQNLKCR